MLDILFIKIGKHEMAAIRVRDLSVGHATEQPKPRPEPLRPGNRLSQNRLLHQGKTTTTTTEDKVGHFPWI